MADDNSIAAQIRARFQQVRQEQKEGGDANASRTVSVSDDVRSNGLDVETPTPPADSGGADTNGKERENESTPNIAEPAAKSRQPTITFHEAVLAHWQGALFDEARALIRDPAYQQRDALELQLATVANHAPRTSALAWPAGIGQEDMDGALSAVAVRVLGANGLVKPQPKALHIAWEDHSAALAANEAYLARAPVIDKLCYSSAVSMITGGKHAGKSTLARWMAVCVAKGMDFLRRSVIQGPVFYIASEDETMPARQELIRLGWNLDDPLRFFSSANMPTDDPLKFLDALATDIKLHTVSLVILDMLFDFVRIRDELGYAETREAVGHIQNVASQTGAHITVIHHAPKHSQLADAAVAALGSQGLAARVSPIILVRRFGPGVHSIVSTTVRDPRGEAIMESRLLRHEDGSVSMGGMWKTYMLAEAYSERVLEFMGAEDGAEVTASDVATGLTIAYEVARACLAALWKGGVIERSGSGKKGQPFRYTVKASNTPHRVSPVGNFDESQTLLQSGRFGYKD